MVEVEYRFNERRQVNPMKSTLLTLFVLVLTFSLFGAEPWLVESARLPAGSEAKNRPRMIWADSFKFQYIADVVGGPIEVERWVNAPPKDYAGKFVLVEVWATWCPPCRRSLPLLEYFQEKYKDDIVVVSICETDENALKRVILEIKLHINKKLYEKGAITEEMYSKAVDLILKKRA